MRPIKLQKKKDTLRFTEDQNSTLFRDFRKTGGTVYNFVFEKLKKKLVVLFSNIKPTFSDIGTFWQNPVICIFSSLHLKSTNLLKCKNTDGHFETVVPMLSSWLIMTYGILMKWHYQPKPDPEKKPIPYLSSALCTHTLKFLSLSQVSYVPKFPLCFVVPEV